MSLEWVMDCTKVLDEVLAERVRQEKRYGDVNDKLIDGTGPDVKWLDRTDYDVWSLSASEIQKVFRWEYEEFEAGHGLPTWMHLVREEVAEAFQESDPDRLAEELIQVAALCVAWVSRIRARQTNG